MINFFKFLVAVFGVIFRSREAGAAENPVIRQQLNVLCWHKPKRIGSLTGIDRAIFVWLLWLWPQLSRAVVIVQPETVVRWHRMGFRAWWRWKSRNLGGRAKIDRELRDLIHRMCKENPLWGAPRIHGELLKQGFNVAQSTISKCMLKHRRPPGQSWKTFLRNHADGIASINFLIVPTIGFRCLYILIVLGDLHRRLVWFGVIANPTAEWIACQLREAFPWNIAPNYLIRDNDGKFGDAFKRSIRRMGIRDRPTAPNSPWQNGYVERAIGSIRREFLGHVIVWNEAHLRGLLTSYQTYYNATRTHLGIVKDSPEHRLIQHHGAIVAVPLLGGLHHRYARI